MQLYDRRLQKFFLCFLVPVVDASQARRTLQKQAHVLIEGKTDAHTVVMQFDTRDPEAEDTPPFIKAAIAWNAHYTNQFPGHAYIFINGSGGLASKSSLLDATPAQNLLDECAEPSDEEKRHLPNSRTVVVGPNGCRLSAVWGKVQAMRELPTLFPKAERFMFLDSDAVAGFAPSLYSKAPREVFDALRKNYPEFSPDLRPLLLQRDAQFYHDLIVRNSPYVEPVNTGVILWFAGAAANSFLDKWWSSSTDAYGGFEGFSDPDFSSSQQFRWHWPWEQDRMVDLVNNPNRTDAGSLVQTIPNSLCKKGGVKCNANLPGFGARSLDKLLWLWKVTDGAPCESLQMLVTNGFYVSRNSTPCYINHFTDGKEDLLNYQDPHAASLMLGFSSDHIGRSRAEFTTTARSVLQGRRVPYLRHDLGGGLISRSLLSLPSK